MTRRMRLTTLILALAILPATAALGEADHAVELVPGEGGFTWDGTETVGVNPNFHPWAPQASDVFPVGECSKDPNYYCDTILVKYVNPVPEDDADGRLTQRSTITIDNYTFPGSDFDLRIWQSNADGERLTMLGETGENPGDPETFTTTITTTTEIAERYVLYEVGYFAAAGGYDGEITF